MSENNDTETPLSPRTVHYEKGKKYFKDRNYRKSIRSFTAAIEASPSDAKLYLDRGLAYIELDKYNDAITDFTKAIEFAPNYAAAFNNRGFAYAKLDRHELAMKDYTKAIQLDPAHMDAYRNRADLFDVLERYIEAISDYTKALELKPTSAITWNDRGETFDRIQHYYDAVKDYTKAIELKPNFAVAYFNRGETYRHLGRLEDAIKDFQQSIALDQDDPDSYRYMGTCLHQLGKIDEAVKYFTAAIDMGDSSASILVSRALAYLDAKKYDSASADVDLALKVKNCNMAHAYYGKAIVLMQSGEETQALKELERAIEIDYTFIPALFYKSLVLMSLKRYKEGIDVLKDITYSYLQPRRHDTTREIIDSLTSDEFQWSAHLFLSFGYRCINLLQESSQEINEMWKVTHQFVNTNEKRNELFFGPNMAELKSYYEACRYMLTARSLFDQGEFKSALKEVDKSIELDGKNPESYALKAMVFNAMGHYKLAVGLCDRALKIEPRSATAVCHKAHATLGLGDPKAAAREIQRSIELDPHLGFSYYVKGLVNIDDKHFKEAVQDYNMFLNCLDAYHFPHLMEIAKSCIHEISHTIPFEKIQLKEEIGKGDYGQVYKAVYNNEIVAAKKYNESTKASAQILHEVATMKLIPSHPNLVKMIGLCVEPLISIMDLCNQGNLQKFLSSAKPIEERIKSKLIMDIAKGMLHLHSQNRPVLHRNLNSTNVLLKETDSQLSAVISDFGITKSKSADKAEDSFKWMAPEVMLEKQYSFMSDVFSFGVIVWEIITQKAPWEGYGEAKMLVAIENGEQLSLPFDISDFMKDLVLNCWEKNPENRWSFGKIVEHLEKNKEVRLFRIFSVHRKQTE